jgi:hypothetical protein
MAAILLALELLTSLGHELFANLGHTVRPLVSRINKATVSERHSMSRHHHSIVNQINQSIVDRSTEK